MSEPISITIEIPQGAYDRADKVLSILVPEGVSLSRSRLQELIQSGQVFLEGKGAISNSKHKVEPGELYRIEIPASRELSTEAQNIPIEIVYEDDDLVVVNKPVGMVVHPARGAEDGTLVNALLYHCGDSLSGIGGVERPGIVHRIDKDTSGLLVVAKNDKAHASLARQFKDHSIHRVYRAFVFGGLGLGDSKVLNMSGVSLLGADIRIDQPLDRHKHDRLKMAVIEGGKRAVTYARPLQTDDTKSLSYVECRLETGRTHQIRVHMTHIGYPLLGDPIYGKGARHLNNEIAPALKSAVEALQGQALHAAELGFIHPRTGEEVMFTAELPAPMALILKLIS